jgi:hypothetical protein
MQERPTDLVIDHRCKKWLSQEFREWAPSVRGGTVGRYEVAYARCTPVRIERQES